MLITLMPIRSAYSDRKGSRNAKYDSLLGNTFSLRTNRASRETIQRIEDDLVKSKEDKEKRRLEEQERLYKKLGIKAPFGLNKSKGHEREVDAVAGLQKYRLGAEKRPWTVSLRSAPHCTAKWKLKMQTPGMGLSEPLRNILYPESPPASANGYSPFSSDPPQQNTSQSFDGQGYLLQAPQLPGLPAVPPNWFLSPQTGWYYVPPDQITSTSSLSDVDYTTKAHSYPHLPASSTLTTPGQTHYSLRYVDPQGYIQTPPRASSASPEILEPKGILKSSNSDPVQSSRRVRFRNTPDIAPQLSQASSMSSVPNGSSPITPLSDPRWEPHRADSVPSENKPKMIDEIPASLRIAHDRLFHIGDNEARVSGRRSGRHLVRELERQAEAAMTSNKEETADMGSYHQERVPEQERQKHNQLMSTPRKCEDLHQSSHPEREASPDSDRSLSPDIPESMYELRNGSTAQLTGQHSEPRYSEMDGYRDHRSLNHQAPNSPTPSSSDNDECSGAVVENAHLRSGHILSVRPENDFASLRTRAQEDSTSSAEFVVEPELKRVRLTERAWQYDIPRDKLPPPSPMKPKPKSRIRNTAKSTSIKVEKPCQSSQIEVSDDTAEVYLSGSMERDETIDGSWPASQGTRYSQSRLEAIGEDREGAPLPLDSDRWVDEGFFDGGGDVGFRVWRDAY